MLVRRVALAAALASALIVGATPAAFGARAVYASGSGHLKTSWYVDFDSGTFNALSGPWDMKYNGVTPNATYLDQDGTALIKLMGATRPRYLKCASANLASTPILVQAPLVGKWFCFKTQDGRFARFRIDSWPPYPGGINLTFTTWV